MWCKPEPSSVSPMYIPGRLRTASRPFSTLMDSAPYRSAPLVFRAGFALMLTASFWGNFCSCKLYTKTGAEEHAKCGPRKAEKSHLYL